MNITKPTIKSRELSQLVVQGIQEKKGMEIVLMDLSAIGQAVSDFFVICSGNTENQVDAS